MQTSRRDPGEPKDVLGTLLAWAVDVDRTPEEADLELRAAGVDVDGFLSRVHERRCEFDEGDRS